MPKHDRQGDIIELIARHHVGMTHASGYNTNQHLFWPWLIQSQILDPEGSALLSNRRCPDFHLTASSIYLSQAPFTLSHRSAAEISTHIKNYLIFNFSYRIKFQVPHSQNVLADS
jgi:hypothetical protein